MSEEFAIEAKGLMKSYGNTQVLDGLDLRVPRGSVYALLGRNGAGKTTTVRILATLSRPDAGRVTVAGFDVLRNRHQVRRAISLTGQYAALDEAQTGRENLCMMGRLSGLPGRQARSRAEELLDQFGLTDAAQRQAGTYSGGMRRRLDLAASLVGRPSVVFLDEPTTGLDLPSRQAMWETVTGLAAGGVTIFLTTQYLEEADKLADQIAVLNAGRLVAAGTAAELKRRVASQRLDLRLASPEAFEAVTRRLTGPALTEPALHADHSELTIGVATDGSAAHVRALLDELDPDRNLVADFAVRGATLDDVFLALTHVPAAVHAAQEACHV
jgi:ABC-2 type transport system ATP-binding protein